MDLIPYLFPSAAGLCAFAVVLLLISQRKQQRRIAALEALVKALNKQKDSTSRQLNELHTVNHGLSQAISALNARLKQLDEQVSNVEPSDPEQKLYSRAVKMVQLGADLAEVMRECELPRAEAELLMRLHGPK